MHVLERSVFPWQHWIHEQVNIICTLPNPACFMVVKLHRWSQGMAKYWFIREQQASG